MGNQSPKFDHLVVLMMENHSFDSMLGYLYHSDNPPPFDKPPRGQSFDGIENAEITSNSCSVDGNPMEVFVGRATSFSNPIAADPYHDYANVQKQLFGYDCLNEQEPWSAFTPPETASMSGFAQNYADRILKQGKPPITRETIAEIMACFGPCATQTAPSGQYAVAPVINRLAANYAVCDNWYASIPSQTYCNRSFLHSAQSNGWVDNTGQRGQWQDNKATTVFERLLDVDYPGIFTSQSAWRIYHDIEDKYPLVFQIHPRLAAYKHAPYRVSMEQFYEDALYGTLPAYAFIEPRISGVDSDPLPHNDQHPVSDIRRGENLINQVYKAVVEGKCWERTLLIITYDEHGGLFDHRAPPSAVPPASYTSSECGFKFDRLGVRVPAVLISPYIEAGTVFHPAQPLDHTSVIKTLFNRWNISPLNARDSNAVDLADALTLDSPCTGKPLMLPSWSLPGKSGKAELNDLQKDVIKIAALGMLSKSPAE